MDQQQVYSGCFATEFVANDKFPEIAEVLSGRDLSHLIKAEVVQKLVTTFFIR